MADERDLSKSVIFARGEVNPPPYNRYFTGTCYVNELVPFDSPLGCLVSNVTFEPGCRNNWHTHSGGQILLVTGGRGWYQEEGKPARALQAGDVVEILPQVKHWHGAAADSWFVHLAIEPDLTGGHLCGSSRYPTTTTTSWNHHDCRAYQRQQPAATYTLNLLWTFSTGGKPTTEWARRAGSRSARYYMPRPTEPCALRACACALAASRARL